MNKPKNTHCQEKNTYPHFFSSSAKF
jgi:hypothetical protein